MKTDDKAAIALFAVAIGGAVALTIANDITAPICKAAAESTPKDKFDFGCLEFWLNRYQSMLAGMLAVFGAGLALFAARWQVKAMNTQLEDARFRAGKAANLRIFHELDVFYGSCCSIVADICNLPAPMGKAHASVPTVNLGDDFAALVPLSFEDTTALFELMRDIRITNQTDDNWLDLFGPDRNEFIQFSAGHLAVRAWQLRSRVAGSLGWPHPATVPWDLLLKLNAKHANYVAENKKRRPKPAANES